MNLVSRRGFFAILASLLLAYAIVACPGARVMSPTYGYNPTQSMTTMVTWQPGGVVSNTVYTDWPTLASAFAPYTGYLIVDFDCTHAACTIPAGTYTFAASKLEWTSAFRPTRSLVTLSTGVAINTLNRVSYLTLLGSGSTIPLQSSATNFTFEVGDEALLSASGSQPLLQATGTGGLTLLLSGTGTIDGHSGSANEVVNYAGVGTFTLRSEGTPFAAIPTKAIGAPTAAQVALQFSAGTSIAISQPGILDTGIAPTPSLYEKANGIAYIDNDAAPVLDASTVQAAFNALKPIFVAIDGASWATGVGYTDNGQNPILDATTVQSAFNALKPIFVAIDGASWATGVGYTDNGQNPILDATTVQSAFNALKPIFVAIDGASWATGVGYTDNGQNPILDATTVQAAFNALKTTIYLDSGVSQWEASTGWVKGWDFDYTDAGNLTITDAGLFTLGGYQFQSWNTDRAFDASTISDAGLHITPVLNSQLQGAFFITPAIGVQVTSALATTNPNYDLRTPMCHWEHTISQNPVTANDLAMFGFVAYNPLVANQISFYAYSGGVGSSQLGVGVQTTFIGNSVAATSDILGSGDNVTVMCIFEGMSSIFASIYVGTWNNGWPSFASLKMRDTSALNTIYSRVSGDAGQARSAADVFTVMTAERNSSATTGYNVTFGHERIDFKFRWRAPRVYELDMPRSIAPGHTSTLIF